MSCVHFGLIFGVWILKMCQKSEVDKKVTGKWLYVTNNSASTELDLRCYRNSSLQNTRFRKYVFLVLVYLQHSNIFIKYIILDIARNRMINSSL